MTGRLPVLKKNCTLDLTCKIASALPFSFTTNNIFAEFHISELSVYVFLIKVSVLYLLYVVGIMNSLFREYGLTTFSMAKISSYLEKKVRTKRFVHIQRQRPA
jgi:hypothetical protein